MKCQEPITKVAGVSGFLSTVENHHLLPTGVGKLHGTEGFSKSLTSKKTESKKAAPVKKSSVSTNPMRTIFIEKIIVSAGATAEALVKAKKLLELLTSRKAQIIASTKRIPDFGVRPGLEVGTRVTLRGKSAIELLRRLLGAVENKLSKKQVSENHLSFGIKEYIEIPGIEYQRDIGIRGFNTTIVFARPGLRVKRKKIKQGTIPHRQYVGKTEIIPFMEERFKTTFT